MEAHGGPDSEQGSSPFEEPEPAESLSGLLVSRDHSAPTPAADHLPGLSALLRVSRDVGAVVLGGVAASSLHGSEDTVTKPHGSQRFVDQSGSTDKTLKLYEGHYHDLLNDLGKERVMADIVEWISTRIPA